MSNRWAVRAGTAITAIALAAASPAGASELSAEHPPLPEIRFVAETPTSHAFSAARYQSQPLDLGKCGYTEEEYLLSGEARVFDWTHGGVQVPFDAARLRQMYGSHAGYVQAVRASAKALVAQRWLTAADGDRIVREAARADLPPSN